MSIIRVGGKGWRPCWPCGYFPLPSSCPVVEWPTGPERSWSPEVTRAGRTSNISSLRLIKLASPLFFLLVLNSQSPPHPGLSRTHQVWMVIFPISTFTGNIFSASNTPFITVVGASVRGVPSTSDHSPSPFTFSSEVSLLDHSYHSANLL